MTDIALISALTWRTLESQREDHVGKKIYVLPDEAAVALRTTRRKDVLHVFVTSLAILARTEKDFLFMWDMLKKRKACLHSKEECLAVSSVTASFDRILRIWKSARSNGVAVVGGLASGAARSARSKEAVSKIKDRWPLPSKEWPTAQLLKEAGVSLNTAKAHLGKRPIAQYNYQAAQKRKARRQEAGRV